MMITLQARCIAWTRVACALHEGASGTLLEHPAFVEARDGLPEAVSNKARRHAFGAGAGRP